MLSRVVSFPSHAPSEERANQKPLDVPWRVRRRRVRSLLAARHEERRLSVQFLTLFLLIAHLYSRIVVLAHC
jgi:hypothetical protein